MRQKAETGMEVMEVMEVMQGQTSQNGMDAALLLLSGIMSRRMLNSFQAFLKKINL